MISTFFRRLELIENCIKYKILIFFSKFYIYSVFLLFHFECILRLDNKPNPLVECSTSQSESVKLPTIKPPSTSKYISKKQAAKSCDLETCTQGCICNLAPKVISEMIEKNVID